MRLCCGLSASHLSAFFTFCSICARGMPSTPLNMSASSFRLAACAVERTSASLPSIALRSRLVTSFMVFSDSLLIARLQSSRSYQRIAAFLEPHRAFGHQLVEVRGERARGDAMDALGHVVVDQRQHLLERGMLEALERRDHLALPVEAVRDQAAHFLV